MRKTIKGTQDGIIIEGTAKILLWFGDQGEIKMTSDFIPYEKISRRTILEAINDGGFGCQKIISAEVDIYISYDIGHTSYDRTIMVEPINLKLIQK